MLAKITGKDPLVSPDPVAAVRSTLRLNNPRSRRIIKETHLRFNAGSPCRSLTGLRQGGGFRGATPPPYHPASIELAFSSGTTRAPAHTHTHSANRSPPSTPSPHQPSVPLAYPSRRLRLIRSAPRAKLSTASSLLMLACTRAWMLSGGRWLSEVRLDALIPGVPDQASVTQCSQRWVAPQSLPPVSVDAVASYFSRCPPARPRVTHPAPRQR